MNSGTASKILRVGIIQGGKIIEERLIRKRESVTIGPDTSNTFIVQTGNLPTVFPLFEHKNGQYALVFTEAMEGRLVAGDSEIDFAALRQQGQARKRQDVYLYPLNDSSKGKVTLGDVTILFQFVPPPTEAVKAELPPNLQGSFLKGVDSFFLTVLAISLLLHFSGATLILLQERPPDAELELDQLQDRFAKVIMPTKVEEPPEPPKPEVAVKEEPKEKKKEEEPEKEPEKQEAQKPPPPPDTVEKKQAIQKAVASKGLLKILGSSAGGSGASAFEDVLGGGTGAGDVAEALSGAGGVGVATSDSLANAGPKGGGTGTVAGIGSLGTSGGGNVNLGNKGDAKVSGRVQDAAPDVDSADVDRNALSRYVKSRMSAIQNCYERELKRNPSLKGKVVVRFSITPAGRSADIEIEENTLGTDSVASCIRTVIRTWVFPFKPESEVPVAYPFVFTPAS